MSGVVGLIGLPYRGLSSLANQLENLVLMKPQRSVGIILPTITLSEDHQDVVQVTNHPVQVSSNISDHAYMEPATVSMLVGWSNADALFDLTESYVREVYEGILEVQAQRQLLEVYTGKRVYRNMMLISVSTQTTAQTEYSLLVQMTCREVIQANVSVGVLSSAQQQALPRQTQSQTIRGVQMPIPVTPRGVIQSIIGGAQIVQ